MLRKLSNASRLHIHLFLKKGWNPTLEEALQVAVELARKNDIPATDTDLEGAAVLYVFGRSIRGVDLAACQSLAPRALELMGDDTTHGILRRDWVKLLLQAGQAESMADMATLSYLGYLKGWDQSALRTRNTLIFWGYAFGETAQTVQSAGSRQNSVPLYAFGCVLKSRSTAQTSDTSIIRCCANFRMA